MEGVAGLEGVLDPEIQLVHAQLLGQEVHLGLVNKGGVYAGDAPDGDGSGAVGAGLHHLDLDIGDEVGAGEEVGVSAHAVVDLLARFVAPVAAVYQDLGVDGDELSILGGAGGAVHLEPEPLGRARAVILPG